MTAIPDSANLVFPTRSEVELRICSKLGSVALGHTTSYAQRP